MAKLDTDISSKVPQEAVICCFAGIGAMSPEIYGELLSEMATKYGVPVEILGPYVTEILEILPCPLD